MAAAHDARPSMGRYHHTPPGPANFLVPGAFPSEAQDMSSYSTPSSSTTTFWSLPSSSFAQPDETQAAVPPPPSVPPPPVPLAAPAGTSPRKPVAAGASRACAPAAATTPPTASLRSSTSLPSVATDPSPSFHLPFTASAPPPPCTRNPASTFPSASASDPSSSTSTPNHRSNTNTTASSSLATQSPAAGRPQLQHRHPTNSAAHVASPIPEECAEESGSECSPQEPLTPVSGRQSRDFQVCHLDTGHRDVDFACSSASLEHHDAPPLVVHPAPDVARSKPAFFPRPATSSGPASAHPPFGPNSTLATSRSYASLAPQSASARLNRPSSKSLTSQSRPPTSDYLSPPVPPIPHSYRPQSSQSSSSTGRLRRKMSSLFRRTNSNLADVGTTMATKESNEKAQQPDASLSPTNKTAPNGHTRRFSLRKSFSTARSITPPSPDGSSTESNDANNVTQANTVMNKNRMSMPPQSLDFTPPPKKTRAQTGLSFRSKVVNFAHGHGKNEPKMHRTRSAERPKRINNHPNVLVDITRQPWAVPPEAGTGMKARRLSLSLPDDFTVDIAELNKEFEYQHKFLGRHGRHVGKGATSKVTLMSRKGCPTEIYAVKEFRSKSSSETVEEYQNKIKSEFSIAKSLHHPNIVETIRLCTHHGRWSHVMEYCAEGDLFGLVQKKYLRDEMREGDRLCLFKQLCQGINYLHSHGIAHRDIKLENLLITKDSKLKITDFGVSEVFTGIHPGLREAGGQCGKCMGDVRYCAPGLCGSLPYMAPEVVSKQGNYDPRPLDVWSSAVVMIYLIFSACLWEKAAPGASVTYDSLVSGWQRVDAKKAKNPDLKDAYPKIEAFEVFIKAAALRRLLCNMLNPDPSKRPTMSQVVNNRWMKNVDCCQPESYEDPVKLIDASQKDTLKGHMSKIFCHNHLPLQSSGHGLPPMPGKPGY